QSHAAEWKDFGGRARTAHQSLTAAELADPLNDGAVRAASAEVAAVDADMAVARAHLRAEVWQVLTPDQRTKAAALLTQGPGGGRGGMRHHGPKQGGQ